MRRAVSPTSETAVSNACKLLLRPHAYRLYSSEAGFMGHFDPSKAEVIERAGGTRTTPGIPDLEALMASPFGYVLKVELKGATTRVKLSQWEYCAHATEIGLPSLIVRSSEALITGLRFLGLLPTGWLRFLPTPHDLSIWPENVNFLPLMRERFWAARGGQMPAYAAGMHPPFNPKLPRMGALPAPSPPRPRKRAARGPS